MAAGTSDLEILLRDVAHDASVSAGKKLALKCEQLTVAVSKSPIQTSAGAGKVNLNDFGFIRPSITVSGTIDNVGGDPAQGDEGSQGYQDMEVVSIGSQNYRIPYKNFLEDLLNDYISSDTADLQLEVGDATTQTGEGHTGGGVYKVLPQQFQFTMLPGQEDRWLFTISFVAKPRGDA